ncbi:MAG TPA: PQQ-binding-like beta-propeller repeat protein, partial [Bryobacteraceae bacterium]
MKALVLFVFIAALASAQDGSALYKQNCATCHDGGMDRAPSRDALKAMSADRVLAAMETGPMISMASRRTALERRAIAEFVSGKKLTGNLETKPSPQAMCSAAGSGNLSQGPAWIGWGTNYSNTRFQDAPNAGLTAADVPRLKVKWAFGFPGDQSANAHPTIAGGRVFVGSAGGTVYSLSAATGCIYWSFETGSTARSAITLHHLDDSYLAFFGDARAFVYALDALTGKLVWKTKVDDFPLAGVTSSPQVYQGRVYFGVKSGEEAAGADPNYECCRFRGSVVALDAVTGKQVWKTYTIDEPKRTKKNAKGVQMWGPSGAPIWSTPVIDPRRNAIYVTTGDNYSEPATRTSDAFMALALDTGKVLWTRQMTADDAYTAACRLPDKTNCPINGPDFDFGASPILVTLPNGKRAMLAGQKSGIVHAIDPDQQGEVIWQVRVGK